VRLCKCAISVRIKTACKYTFANWESINLCKITFKQGRRFKPFAVQHSCTNKTQVLDLEKN
jgi:hypothetical protein